MTHAPHAGTRPDLLLIVRPIIKRWLFALAFLTSVLGATAVELEHREWKVDGVKREGVVRVPAAAPEPAPVIFVFHGHGGGMRSAARSMPAHQHWPEAVVVYLQGLPTPGRLTDPEGRKSGWQMQPGHQNDRDLRFFDAVWKDLQEKHRIDPSRVYAMGHSNGGSFTYLLWAKRAEVFAAFGPSAAVASPSYGKLLPRPAIHLAARNDELVKYEWQRIMIEKLRRTQASGSATEVGGGLTLYASDVGAPLMVYLHDGGHAYPEKATRLIVEYFKQHRRGGR